MTQTHGGSRAISRRATRATVDLGAIAHNVRVVRDAVGPSTRIMAVVKANAYGHGADRVARTCLDAGAEWLAVAAVDEGLSLRAAGIAAPILVTGPSAEEEHSAALTHDLTLAVGSLHMAAALASVARAAGAVASIHVKVDTGLSRFGIPAGDATEEVAALAGLPGLRVGGIFTHLAASEETDKGPALAQVAAFRGVLDALERRGVEMGLRHVANSGGALEIPEARFDMVRPGIALYGYPPAGYGADRRGLRPALTLHTRLVRVSEVPPGTGVGYNHTFRTARHSRLGLVPLGYADGLPRLLSNRGHLLVRGRRCPIVGTVAMDQTVLDITDVPAAELGDAVVALGAQGDEWIGADEIGMHCGTNAYETLCRLGPRVPRDYIA